MIDERTDNNLVDAVGDLFRCHGNRFKVGFNNNPLSIFRTSFGIIHQAELRGRPDEIELQPLLKLFICNIDDVLHTVLRLPCFSIN